MNWRARPGSQAEQVGRLVLAGLVVVFLPQLPLGNFIAYPFMILTTWFHEMGHGIAAMATGARFERLVILPSGSGYAESYFLGEPGAVQRAMVAAGGPLGPVLAGSALIAATRRRALWRPALYVLAGILALSAVIWVRSTAGLLVLPLIALGLVLLARRGRDGLVRFAVQFLGMLGALSMLRDWDYLFSEGGMIAGRRMVSDTQAIEDALLLPHWVWAIAIVLFSGLTIGAALRYALAEDGRSASARRWN